MLYTTAKNANKIEKAPQTIEKDAAEMTIKISLSRLKDGGAPIFLMHNENHIKDIRGDQLRIPLLRIIDRELLRWYIKLAPRNIPEELNPCAMAISAAPLHAQGEFTQMDKAVIAI